MRFATTQFIAVALTVAIECGLFSIASSFA